MEREKINAVFYLRHGDPIYNPDSLTPLGMRQADALAKQLSLYGPDKMFTSSSHRAVLTAQPTCELLDMTPTVLDWMNESYAARDFGSKLEDGKWSWSFANPKYVTLFNSKEIRALGEDWACAECFKDTGFAAGLKRINAETDAFLETLGYRHDRENCRYEAIGHSPERVAVFAHQGFGLSFLASLLDIPYPYFSTHFDMSHSGMTVINFSARFDYVYPKVLQLSNDSHLYREGLPTKYHHGIYF